MSLLPRLGPYVLGFVLVVLGWLLVQRSIEARARAEWTIESQRTVIAGYAAGVTKLRQERERLDAALAQRKAAGDALAATLYRTRGELEKIQQAEPASAEWGAVGVPGGVRGFVRALTGGAGAGSGDPGPAKRATRADADTVVHR